MSSVSISVSITHPLNRYLKHASFIVSLIDHMDNINNMHPQWPFLFLLQLRLAAVIVCWTTNPTLNELDSLCSN